MQGGGGGGGDGGVVVVVVFFFFFLNVSMKIRVCHTFKPAHHYLYNRKIEL